MASLFAKSIYSPTFTVSKQGWRRAGASPSTRRSAQKSVASYKEHRPGPRWEGDATRILAIVLLAAGFVGLLFAWLWAFPNRQQTSMLVVTFEEYDAPVPPNAFAAEDNQNFQQAFSEYKNIRLDRVDPSGEASELIPALTSFVKEAVPGGPDKVVLLYLSAHGLVNDEGQACLLLPEHDPLDAKDWLPIAEILKGIDKAAAAKDVTAVLMLDAQRIDQEWRLGVVANAFTLALEDHLKKKPLQNCVVLTAASGIQKAVAAPSLGATPFGYFVAQGLRFDADGFGGAKRDDLVTLGELEKYVVAETQKWTARQYGLLQRPQLFATAQQREFQLVTVSGDSKLATQAWSPRISADDFKGIFDKAGRLEAAQVWKTAPYEWSQVQFLLKRLDAESLAGRAYEKMATGTLDVLDRALEQLEDREASIAPDRPLSLAMWPRVENNASRADQLKLEEVWEQWIKKPTEAKRPDDYESLAAFIWHRMSQGTAPLTLQELQQGLAFCGGSTAPEIDYPEIAMLRLLLAWVDWKSPAAEKGIPRELLTARGLSESLAAQPEPRIHYLIGRELKNLDNSAAAALDRVLVASDDLLTEAKLGLAELLKSEQGYHALKTRADDAVRMFAVRDAALAMAFEVQELEVQRVRNTGKFEDAYLCKSLFETTGALSKELDRVISAEEGVLPDPARLGDLVDKLEDLLAGIRREYSIDTASLQSRERGADATTAAEAHAILRCMLQFDESRTQLHQRYFKQICGAPTTEVPVEEIESKAPRELKYLEWLGGTGLAPLDDFLSDPAMELTSSEGMQEWSLSSATPITSLDDGIRSLARLSKNLRQLIAASPAASRRLQDQSESLWNKQEAADARTGLSKADVLSRLMYAIAGDELYRNQQKTPAQLLHKLDLQAWLAWQGGRVLDDCWGALNSSDTGRTPYFATAANRALDEAEELGAEMTFERDALRNRIDETVQMVRNWSPLRQVNKLHVAETEVDFLECKLSVQGDEVFGGAAIYVSDGDEDVFGRSVRRRQVNKLDNGDFTLQMRPEAVREVPLITANALFRGHHRSMPISIGRGVSVQWSKPTRTDAKVIVRGDAKQVSQIVFVVDCSRSMLEANRNKLAEGIEVLRSILRQLSKRDDQYHVCLIFYGHRMGWLEGGGKTARPGTSWDGEPGNDVEIVQPMTPIRSESGTNLRDIEAKLSKAAPWGETPLYLASLTALNQFNVNEPGPCHLIAITDGENWVARGQKGVTDYTAEDVKDRLRRFGRELHVLVVEFGDPHSKDRGKLGEILQTANPPGRYAPVNDPDALARALEDALRIDRYCLGDVKNPSRAPDWRELGERTEVVNLEEPQDFEIRLERNDARADVTLHGGDQLALEYRDGRLHFPRYESGLSEAKSVEPSRYVDNKVERIIAAHLPTRLTYQSPVFRVSVQREDQFSPRPEIIWARLQEDPGEFAADRPAGRTYYFFDREFEPDLPAPVLNFRAHGWESARPARIELSVVESISELPSEVQSQFQWRDVSGSGPVLSESYGDRLNLRTERADEGIRVVVEERARSGEDGGPLYVQLNPPADQITRTFFPDGYARHEFHYKKEPRSFAIRVLARKQIGDAGMSVEFKNVVLPR